MAPPAKVASICVPAMLTIVDELMTVVCPAASRLTVDPITKFWPLMARLPPPWQMVAGRVLVTIGGSLTTKLTISVEEQPAGSGFFTVTGYEPLVKVPLGTVRV